MLDQWAKFIKSPFELMHAKCIVAHGDIIYMSSHVFREKD